MIVADSSAIIHYLFRTGEAERAASLLLPREHDVRVPHICDVEVLAAIRRVLGRNAMDLQRALEALEDYRDLPITRHEQLDLMPRGLGLRSNFTASDAMYVALAELFDGTLLTADRRLAQATATHTRVAVEQI